MRACFVRSVWAVIAALLLAASAASGDWVEAVQAASAGDWQISQKVDSVTGARIANIFVRSSKVAHSGLLFAPDSYLQLGCLKGQSVLQLVFAFQVGSKNDSDVSYGFDRTPNHRVTARFMRGLKIMVIENTRGTWPNSWTGWRRRSSSISPSVRRPKAGRARNSAWPGRQPS